ncbi:MAG: tRNA (adenosine(37)-N6)-dimethylallyltransferase MiaA [Blastopirellula sp.]|nr:MAG: tRNA (adenosine(37)-N6)-dimethylallyltransferase MiaA [Blastopirellula sp.]
MGNQDPNFNQCWFLTGPTASGKTSVAIPLAQQINAEIISLDSMALYRQMDIGTAKPTPAEQAQVPHHLINVLNPDEESSIAFYIEQAAQAKLEIEDRGKQVLFVGGTPLYLKALLRGMNEGPAPDPEFRAAVEAEVKTIGPAALHERLKNVDPLSAARIHPNDVRRVIRALEVYHATGLPISHTQLDFDEGYTAAETKVFVLNWPREQVHKRINARVDAMFEAGLVEETQGLLEEYKALGTTALQAVGYREVIEHLEGKIDLAEAINQVKAHTRQFAKRQCTWYRSMEECRYIDLTTTLDPIEIANQIVQDASVEQ